MSSSILVMVLVVVVVLLLRKFFLHNERISNVNHLLSFVLVSVSMLVALLVCVVCLMS